ncbi:DUF881 domain-containing protein [Streptomyces sp. NPDC001156]
MSNTADSAQPGSDSPETGSTGSASPRTRRLRPVRVLTVGVFALAGLLFFTSFNTARGTNIRTDSSLLKLSDLIHDRSHKNALLDESNATLRDDVDTLAKRTGGSTSKAEEARLAALEKNAGTEKLTGRAVTVTLNDAPPNATAKLPGYPEPQPDYLVIHQQDLQAVVNALWQGGAQGIKVMDQRLISTSAVRCVGNTLILQGRVYSPPYKITAVGDPDKLQKAVAASPAIQNYMVYVNVYGLGWKVTEDGPVTLPGYSGTVDLHYAKPVE